MTWTSSDCDALQRLCSSQWVWHRKQYLITAYHPNSAAQWSQHTKEWTPSPAPIRGQILYSSLCRLFGGGPDKWNFTRSNATSNLGSQCSSTVLLNQSFNTYHHWLKDIKLALSSFPHIHSSATFIIYLESKYLNLLHVWQHACIFYIKNDDVLGKIFFLFWFWKYWNK